MSNRKPHNDHAGYVAMLRNFLTDGYLTIYRAKEQGIDDSDGKYAVVCSAHATIIKTSSISSARQSMKWPDFCEYCLKIIEGESG